MLFILLLILILIVILILILILVLILIVIPPLVLLSFVQDSWRRPDSEGKSRNASASTASSLGRAEREGCDPSGPCLPFDLDRGAQAAVLEGDPKVGGFHIVQ